MATLPDVTETIRDGALGQVAQNTSGVLACIGVSSSGASNVPTAVADIQTLVSTFGRGPLVEAVAHALQIGGGPVVVMRVTTSAVGSQGAVTRVGTGACVVTTTGTALDDAAVQVLVVAAGTNPAAGTATFKYSFDGGKTYSSEIAVPTSGTYVLPNTGITLAFSAASLVSGDTYSFAASAPAYSLGELSTAMDALLADPSTWFLVHVVGIPADVSSSASVFAALETKMQGAATSYRYARALMQCADDTDANIKAGFASQSGTRTLVGAGFENLMSALTGSAQRRGASWVAAARASGVPPHEDLGRTATGPHAGIVALLRDEQKTPNLDQARFVTLRTIIGMPGFYVTNGNIMCPVGSDFSLLQLGRVMDVACQTARTALMRFLNDSVRVNKLTGFILEQDARAIEAYVDSALRAALTQPGFASDVSVVLSRGTNILSTKTLPTTVRVLPLGYAKYITVDIGFTNPATQPV